MPRKHDSVTTQRELDASVASPSSDDMLLVAGEGRLSAHPLTGDQLVIGRSSACDVRLDHRSLSRRHAVLRRRGGLTVQDLGSTNGTRVGREVLQGGEPRALVGGEGFHIGPFSFLVVQGRTDVPSWQRTGAERLIVDDPSPDRVSRLVRDVAASEVNVLIQGETGVGKEVLAETIQALSGRTGPLVRINCAALSETLLESELFGHEKGAFTGAVAAKPGLLEAAAGGSAFLDEIGEMPPGIQAKLLRAVEAREVMRLGATRASAIDTRFIAATNRDLPAEVAAGRFRHDLYFRLDGVTLRIPPLRERRRLIGPLALRFLAEACERTRRDTAHVAPELIAALEAHDWPGNVRELKAVLERALLLARGAAVGVRHLTFSPRPAQAAPAPAPTPAAVPAHVPAVVSAHGPAAPAAPDDSAIGSLTPGQRDDRRRVVAALEACAGNQTRAAKQLGIARSTLVHKLALYGIPRPKAAPPETR